MTNNAPQLSDKYDPQSIELKWQQKWAKDKVWEVVRDPSKEKFYILDMFPYPSGRLHMGHVRNYTLGDVIGRFQRGLGFNVLHPMGWDAFGLPAENAAIKNKVHPEKWTLENIVNMRKQFERLGIGVDWSREIATCLPEYYRWEQEFFIELYENNLAYRKSSTVNWCPSCQTVLANEQVEDGKCWRCESVTTTKELEQWFLKTTTYAESLLNDLDRLPGWPDRVKNMQRHWIGKSVGTEIDFQIEGLDQTLSVFTTRPDTLMGVTFMAIAPENALCAELIRGKQEEKSVQDFSEKVRKMDKFERTSENSEKEGVFTGSYAIHPLNGSKIPIFAANFVVTDYGTGALMAVPGHDARDHAFAKKYSIPIIEVIQPPKNVDAKPIDEEAYTSPGTLVNSDQFDGLESENAKVLITKELERVNRGRSKTNFKLRDWGLSRQRYWGTPIPMVYCEDCGIVPVPKSELPVELPKNVEFAGEGGSPLATHPDFVETTCPKCGGRKARRETDTMDTFMESSWYYLRYLTPKSDTVAFDKEDLKYWLGVDQYIGGIEHATMHLLYFRFFHKALRDLGYFPDSGSPVGLAEIDRDEPVRRLMNQGIVYKDGAKMSKSKGNVVEPDAIIGKYGADTARMFSLFAAPPEKELEWSDNGVEGSFRFINRVWRIVSKNYSLIKDVEPYSGKHAELGQDASRKLRSKTHQTIAKVRKDFEENYRFNTAIAAIMELVNETYAYPVQMGSEETRSVMREAIEATLRLLYPFVPHVSEELWEQLGNETMLSMSELPSADSDALVREVITIVVQVNGKLRSQLSVSPSLEKDQVIDLAEEDEKVSAHLEGKNIVKTVYVPGKLVNFVAK